MGNKLTIQSEVIFDTETHYLEPSELTINQWISWWVDFAERNHDILQIPLQNGNIMLSVTVHTLEANVVHTSVVARHYVEQLKKLIG